MRATGERGQVTAFLAIFVVTLVAVAGLVIDGGYALAAKRRAVNEAEGAARAAAESVTPAGLRQGIAVLDPDRARVAADEYLSKTGHRGTIAIEGQQVSVTVSFEQPLLVLGFGGLGRVTVTGHGEARPVRGLTEEER
jgi:Flp pilus assembly protein TadG